MKDADDDEPHAPEEYPIEETVVNVCDFITPMALTSSAFESQWTALQGKNTTNTYALPVKNLTAAAQQLVDFFEMHVDGGKPERIATKSHVVNMAGLVADEGRTALLVSERVLITD
jgi:coatomer protein complex subunit gamma